MAKTAVIYIHGKGGNAGEADTIKSSSRNVKSSVLITSPKLHGRLKKNLQSILMISVRDINP